ncbi:MAG: FadR family transcriptional regulator [Eubacteriaceae bacterium]|nr:FadR family transcriptional regulator [Eubacteriaceae bacterium]
MRKLEKINLTDQICVELKKNIIDGYWKEGDKIPSENELAQMLGVSRISIRAALQRLQVLGYIETRGGEGSFVRKFSLSNIFNVVSDDIIMNDSAVAELREFRKNMELDCCRLAIERGTKEEIRQLEEILKSLFNITKMDDFLEMDKNFHMQIAKMSKNSLYELMLEVTSEANKLYNKKMYQQAMKKYPDDNKKIWNIPAGTHLQIVQAIKDKDFDKCKKVYAKMFEMEN